MNLKQAFTLIELLVVIAVIGILSGLIVVSMNGTTQKALIAKSQIYSSSLRNALMANLVSEWKLDEVNSPSSGQTPDTWSNNTGVLSGTGGSQNLPQLKTTGCASGNCISFDGTDDKIISNVFSTSIDSDFTIGVWLNSSVIPASQMRILDLAQSSTNGLQICMTATGFFIVDNSGGPTSSIWNTTASAINTWHYIVVSRSGTTYKLYVDGSYINSAAGTAPTYVRAYLGGAFSGYFWNGIMDDVRLYNAALSTSQIKQQYYLGLNNLLSNNEVGREEYSQKFNLK